MGINRKINRMITAPLPRCFQGISCAHLPPADDDAELGASRRRRRRTTVIRLIKADGVVKVYDRPIKAQELMEEFPKHMVCRSDCFYIGQVTPALAHHDRLQLGHNYFLLPANFFQTALTFATLVRCRFPVPGRPPFELEKTPAGGLRIKVIEEVIMQYQKVEAEAEAEAAEKIIGVCTTPQLKKDYELLVGRRHHWKPKLDTISEKKSQQKKKMRKTKSSLV